MNPLILVAGLFLLVQFSEAKLKEGDCEVCIKFLKKVESTLTEENRKNNDALTKILKKACKKAKGKENRFCYYVGGTEDAATYILNDITKPLSFFKPVENICESLKRKDPQICELQYEKEIDWSKVNLKKMRVRELKNILNKWDETCDGCLEKSDYVKRIETLRKERTEL